MYELMFPELMETTTNLMCHLANKAHSDSDYRWFCAFESLLFWINVNWTIQNCTPKKC